MAFVLGKCEYRSATSHKTQLHLGQTNAHAAPATPQTAPIVSVASPNVNRRVKTASAAVPTCVSVIKDLRRSRAAKNVLKLEVPDESTPMCQLFTRIKPRYDEIGMIIACYGGFSLR
jgi:hypothetical protein